MSAFVVSKSHVDALISAGLSLPGQYGPLRWFERDLTADDERDAYAAGQPWGPRAVELFNQLRRELTEETAGVVGAMLWAENVRSVNHRYAEEEWEEPYVYEPLRLPGVRKGDRGALIVPTPVQTLAALACYEYQSCEHPGWRASEAWRFCEALKDAAISLLEGYRDGPWEITSGLSLLPEAQRVPFERAS